MTELTGTQISQLTAMILGTEPKRANSKGAAVARFLKVAADNGIATPVEILKRNFDDACAALTAPAKPKADRAPRKTRGKRAAAVEAAKAGTLPQPPDFSAATHARYRDKLNELIALAKAGDVRALKAVEIKPYSSSPKAMDRYRNLCVMAIEARA